jgi:hypothetical protein
MPGTQLVIVEKTGELSEIVVNKFKNADLYKKCNFRKPDSFKKRTTWERTVGGVKFVVDLYSRDFGKANQENKYDFPPPIDTELYFGSCVLVRRACKGDDDAVSMTISEWTVLYEALFGGFEDLSATAVEDANEVDELDGIPEEAKTDNGYLKDGFVVEDDEEIEYDTGSSNNDEELSDSELSEEDYIYSDEV